MPGVSSTFTPAKVKEQNSDIFGFSLKDVMSGLILNTSVCKLHFANFIFFSTTCGQHKHCINKLVITMVLHIYFLHVFFHQITHWHSPNFFAYFAAASSYPAMLADMLCTALGCIGFSWVIHQRLIPKIFENKQKMTIIQPFID